MNWFTKFFHGKPDLPVYVGALNAQIGEMGTSLAMLLGANQSLCADMDHMKDLVASLTSELGRQRAGLTADLALAMKDVRIEQVKLRNSIPSLSTPAQIPDLTPLDDRTRALETEVSRTNYILSKAIDEVSDTVNYLLVAPPLREIREITSVPDPASSILAAFQGWVRPMGQ